MTGIYSIAATVRHSNVKCVVDKANKPIYSVSETRTLTRGPTTVHGAHNNDIDLEISYDVKLLRFALDVFSWHVMTDKR